MFPFTKKKILSRERANGKRKNGPVASAKPPFPSTYDGDFITVKMAAVPVCSTRVECRFNPNLKTFGKNRKGFQFRANFDTMPAKNNWDSCYGNDTKRRLS